VRLETPAGFADREAILNIAQEKRADAVYPGYGFLAEDPEFIQACESAGIAFIGPPSGVVKVVRSKTGVLERARQAGFPTIQHSHGVLDGERPGFRAK
jgi:pyruvate carboxylase